MIVKDKHERIVSKAVREGHIIELPPTVISEDKEELEGMELEEAERKELAIQAYMNQSLNQRYRLGGENLTLGHQHKFDIVFQKQERVEAELVETSDQWELARIQSHDDYFTTYKVYFENGQHAELPPERIRKLGNKQGGGMSDE